VGRRNDDRLECSPEELVARRAEFERRRRISRSAPSEPEPLLGSAHRSWWIWISCDAPGCGHYAAVPLTPFILRWGPDAPLGWLRQGFVCTRCGGRATSARWPNNDKTYNGPPPIDGGRQWTGREVWPEPLSMHYLASHGRGWDGKTDWHPVLGIIAFDAMCNLYSNTRSRDAIRSLFRISDNRAYGFEPMPAIFPKSVAPIVRLAANGEREMVPATWGFPLLREGYAPKPVTNVRDDTVLTSRFWRPSFDARRCLVPASSYCEPDENKPAGWHWFGLKDDTEERPLFAFPGIWKRYRGPLKKNGDPVEADVFAFITTQPNSLTATILHDRMPVLLSNETDFETWLTAPPDVAYGLVRTYEAERMQIVQSGAEKQDLLGALG
jgi:putative SOS response-associated peptidase YedK